MFLILITSQIVNFKMNGDVLRLRKCYQCGGETLDPVVKHSVSDTVPLRMIRPSRVTRPLVMTEFGCLSYVTLGTAVSKFSSPL